MSKTVSVIFPLSWAPLRSSFVLPFLSSETFPAPFFCRRCCQSVTSPGHFPAVLLPVSYLSLTSKFSCPVSQPTPGSGLTAVGWIVCLFFQLAFILPGPSRLALPPSLLPSLPPSVIHPLYCHKVILPKMIL